MQYPKKLMSISELVRDCGYKRDYLERIYRTPGQTMARKLDPTKINSKIVFDTEELEKDNKSKTKLGNQEASRHFRIEPAKGVAI